MRISDWSSDVCSSDLRVRLRLCKRIRCGAKGEQGGNRQLEKAQSHDLESTRFPDRSSRGDGQSTLSDLCFFNNPRALAGSLERPRRRGLRPCLAEQAFDLFCGEPVGLATELAADVGTAPDDRGPGLVPAQRLEHGGHPSLRAGAGE